MQSDNVTYVNLQLVSKRDFTAVSLSEYLFIQPVIDKLAPMQLLARLK
jgi:hypothetical protein